MNSKQSSLFSTMPSKKAVRILRRAIPVPPTSTWKLILGPAAMMAVLLVGLYMDYTELPATHRRLPGKYDPVEFARLEKIGREGLRRTGLIKLIKPFWCEKCDDYFGAKGICPNSGCNQALVNTKAPTQSPRPKDTPSDPPTPAPTRARLFLPAGRGFVTHEQREARLIQDNKAAHLRVLLGRETQSLQTLERHAKDEVKWPSAKACIPRVERRVAVLEYMVKHATECEEQRPAQNFTETPPYLHAMLIVAKNKRLYGDSTNYIPGESYRSERLNEDKQNAINSGDCLPFVEPTDPLLTMQ